MHVLISEFMDAPAVDALRQRFDVRYAPTWWSSATPCCAPPARPMP